MPGRSLNSQRTLRPSARRRPWLPRHGFKNLVLAAAVGLPGIAASCPPRAFLRLLLGAALSALVGLVSLALCLYALALLLECCSLLVSLCLTRRSLLVSLCRESCCPRTRGLGCLHKPGLLACTGTTRVEKRAIPRLPALPTQRKQVSGCPWELVLAKPLGVVEGTATERSQGAELRPNRTPKHHRGKECTARARQLRIASLSRFQNELELTGKGPPQHD